MRRDGRHVHDLLGFVQVGRSRSQPEHGGVDEQDMGWVDINDLVHEALRDGLAFDQANRPRHLPSQVLHDPDPDIIVRADGVADPGDNDAGGVILSQARSSSSMSRVCSSNWCIRLNDLLNKELSGPRLARNRVQQTFVPVVDLYLQRHLADGEVGGAPEAWVVGPEGHLHLVQGFVSTRRRGSGPWRRPGCSCRWPDSCSSSPRSC